MGKTFKGWVGMPFFQQRQIDVSQHEVLSICTTNSAGFRSEKGNRVLVWTISQKSLNHTSMDHDFLQKNMPNIGDVNALFSCLDLHRFSTNFG